MKKNAVSPSSLTFSPVILDIMGIFVYTQIFPHYADSVGNGMDFRPLTDAMRIFSISSIVSLLLVCYLQLYYKRHKGRIIAHGYWAAVSVMVVLFLGQLAITSPAIWLTGY
jgi:hypothetical protein